MYNGEVSNVFMCLVGSNPLPNYIVTDFLMSHEDKYRSYVPKPDIYYFIHTGKDGTEDYQKRIKRKVSDSNICQGISLSDSRDAGKIINSLNNKLNKFIHDNNIKTIHLNYTGGTKPMAVLTYKWLQEQINGTFELILSDIDPKNNKLNIMKDREKGSLSYILNYDLTDIITIHIEDLLELHGMKLINTNKNAEGQIDRYLNIERLSKEEQWNRKQSFFTKCLKTNKETNEKKLKKILQVNKSLNDRKRNREIGKPSKKDWKTKDKKELNNELNQSFSEYMPNHLKETLEEYEEEKFAEIVGFFAGKWLEYYIYERIYKILEKENLIDKMQLYHSVNVDMKVDGHIRPAEIDIIAIKGYKLYYFTITTGKRIGVCKQKAFEGIFRARQLGGEHARVIGVNMMPNEAYNGNNENYNRKLEADLKSFKLESGEIDIIGYDDVAATPKKRLN
ncbi:hypothetical protein [Schnuerera ultunensis]|uniref:Card1 CARF domain-containing protein n=1 Tax=[Clostridium] ultunense Esp TaxID=1288971 RepID=A0A1M4PLX4_9FIRM|nr:hypothetical protein [Schnuerera ultunensis]SHD76454.1 conserved protein of unknown function [[Clostridium] ultunense Esp]